MKKACIIGVDLGTRNSLIYSSTSNAIVFAEPTSVAIDRKTRQVREIGFLADRIKDKAPYNYQVISPVSHGFIADEEACNLLLTRALEGASLGRVYRGATYVFSAPSVSTPVNTNALINIGKSLSAKEIFLESQAKLAALGATETIYSPSATLVCHIGAGITDIAIISMGEIIQASTCYISSTSFDEAIRRYLITKQHLTIGLKSAESVKMRIANVATVTENQLVEVKGRDTITNLPAAVVVSTYELRNVLRQLLDMIILKITDLISLCQPELVSDLAKNGLLLTGGGALLGGLKDYLQSQLSIPVRLADRPSEAIARGLAIYSRLISQK